MRRKFKRRYKIGGRGGAMLALRVSPLEEETMRGFLRATAIVVCVVCLATPAAWGQGGAWRVQAGLRRVGGRPGLRTL